MAAAKQCGIASAISFTLDVDGRLPNGQGLGSAIAEVDSYGGPHHYLVNCAHPHHALAGLSQDSHAGVGWQRITGIRANASTRSHIELDAADALDAGNIDEFVAAHGRLAEAVGPFTILGGCCGTDSRHVAALWGVGQASVTPDHPMELPDSRDTTA